jgi:hypothetical protein
MSQIVLESNIQHDEYTSKTSSFFDVPFSEKNIDPPDEWLMFFGRNVKI